MDNPDLVVGGSGAADCPRPDLIDPQARAIIRYADAAAWVTCTAVAHAVAATAGRVEPFRHDVGVAVVSDHGPVATMEQVQAAAEAGFSSPLRYTAASPGLLVGVTCIAFGFRGPTLNLAMPAGEGLPIARLVGCGWLARGTARLLVLAVYSAAGASSGSARAVVLGSRSLLGEGELLSPEVTMWLGRTGC